MRLGIAVPMFANPGVPVLRTPGYDRIVWSAALEAVAAAEALGYDSAWVAEHLFLGRDGEFLEHWTVASALVASTSRIRIISHHYNNNFREAPLTAKMTATLDHISGGRFELFISAGARELEHVSYGFDWQPIRERRVAKLAEAVTVIRELWSGEPTDLDGEFYRLKGAISAPRPTQADGPPIWIGEPLDPATVRLIAGQADGWNMLPSTLAEIDAKKMLVLDACINAGRDPASLEMSLETQVLVLEDDSEWEELLIQWQRMRDDYPLGPAMRDLGDLATVPPLSYFKSQFLVGTEAEVTQRLADYRELGVTELVCWFMDLPSQKSLRTLATMAAKL